jgi:hypothetical protein
LSASDNRNILGWQELLLAARIWQGEIQELSVER